MKSNGKTIFWLGFLITLGTFIAYIIVIGFCNDEAMNTWVTSLSMCGIELLGAILMLVGRSIERKAGDNV